MLGFILYERHDLNGYQLFELEYYKSMSVQILPIHKERFAEIYKDLHALRDDENSFF